MKYSILSGALSGILVVFVVFLIIRNEKLSSQNSYLRYDNERLRTDSVLKYEAVQKLVTNLIESNNGSR